MLRNGLEPWHLLILAIVVIMLFGSKKLPDSARALGQSLRILKSETKAMKEDGATPGTTPGPASTGPLTTGTARSAPGDTPPARPTGPEGGTRDH
ncbi:Sec-independent protein translocase subunit TatA [Streptomyces sp. JH34]|uniref:Sec-independent protein translocase subunit TatA n=1 Tax=Streptomyces sp. JH34 TaxID=2793633 RepID=UPI0023F7F438|nr:Sec-independent protein translocase subunit TatA [Streptomyces sp. JH34]MDF6022399.1 Sec-independent protein translocase subunit TatA [Streptomyces sp. JH34]